MSTFKVEVVRIDEVRPHPNADRLSLARVRGFQVVTERDLYTEGDFAVYLPEQAVLPPLLLRALGVEDKLAGKEKNRVKTIRLRGELSQGMLVPARLLLDLVTSQESLRNRLRETYPDHVRDLGGGGTHMQFETGLDLTEVLGVTKWEEPIPIHMAGTALPRPGAP